MSTGLGVATSGVSAYAQGGRLAMAAGKLGKKILGKGDDVAKKVSPALDPKRNKQIQDVVDSLDKTGKPPQGVLQGKARGRPRGEFGNNRGTLPTKGDKSYYTESDVFSNAKGKRGAERIVTGKGGEVYYTPDHYDNFVKLR